MSHVLWSALHHVPQTTLAMATKDWEEAFTRTLVLGIGTEKPG